MDPVELPPARAACCPEIGSGCRREDAVSARIQEVLCHLTQMFPTLFVTVDIWRPLVLTPREGSFPDDGVISWVRIAEGVRIASIKDQERWFQADVGLIHKTIQHAWMADVYELLIEDHIEYPKKEFMMVVDVIEQGGVIQAKVDHPKSNFVRPDKTEPTHRIISAGARII